MIRASLIACSMLLLTCDVVEAQIPRERVRVDAPVESVFWAQKVILTNSVYNLPARNLNVTIMHAFGIATNGAYSLFGMDDPANIRIGLDYGITDWLSVGIGRSRFDKLFDGRFKANLLRQTEEDTVPLEIAVSGTIGLATLRTGQDLAERLNYFGSLMLARKFADQFSFQASPMIAHFGANFFDPEAGTETAFGVGLAGMVELNPRFAFLVEFVPVFTSGDHPLTHAFSAGFDIDTGGHVFQIFLTTSQWLTEQHVMTRNVDDFFDGNFRIGFNVNRVFRL